MISRITFFLEILNLSLIFEKNRTKIEIFQEKNGVFICKIQIRGNIHFIFLLSPSSNPRFNSDDIKFSGSVIIFLVFKLIQFEFWFIHEKLH